MKLLVLNNTTNRISNQSSIDKRHLILRNSYQGIYPRLLQKSFVTMVTCITTHGLGVISTIWIKSFSYLIHKRSVIGWINQLDHDGERANGWGPTKLSSLGRIYSTAQQVKRLKKGLTSLIKSNLKEMFQERMEWARVQRAWTLRIFDQAWQTQMRLSSSCHWIGRFPIWNHY